MFPDQFGLNKLGVEVGRRPTVRLRSEEAFASDRTLRAIIGAAPTS